MQYHPVLTPELQAWRRGSDPRGLLLAGRALVLQVAHPTVAAGVREHSGFRADPWGRLERTLESLYTVLYSPDAAAECARLRALHRTIRGVAPGGRRYSALEPEAYAWVHATIIETIAVAQAWAARPLEGEQLDRYYAEMREVGGMLGLRSGDLPETWDGFLAWYDGMVRTRLEDSDVVQQVIDSLSRPARPPVPHLPERCGRSPGIPSATSSGSGWWGCCRRPCASASGWDGAAPTTSSCAPSAPSCAQPTRWCRGACGCSAPPICACSGGAAATRPREQRNSAGCHPGRRHARWGRG